MSAGTASNAGPAEAPAVSAKEPAPDNTPPAAAPPAAAEPVSKGFEPLVPVGAGTRPRGKSTLFDIPGPGGGLGGLTPRPAGAKPGPDAAEPDDPAKRGKKP